MKTYEEKYISALNKSTTRTEREQIIQKIYQDGFEDGVNNCLDEKTLASLEEVVCYLHADERKHWEELGKPKEHIYKAVHSLAKWLDDEKNGEHLEEE